MTYKTTFAGTMVYSSDTYKYVFLDEVMNQDGTPNFKGGILAFCSPTVDGPPFDDWVENFQKFFDYLLGQDWCIKWTDCPDSDKSLERITTSENMGLNVRYKGEILEGSGEFKFIWLCECVDAEGNFDSIDIFVSAGGRSATFAKYQVSSYRDVLIFLKQMEWAVLWTVHYPTLIAIIKKPKSVLVDILYTQRCGFISELQSIPLGNELLFKTFESECLLLLKRGDQVAVDASNETQLTIELDDLTLQQLINILQHRLDIKSRDALEFKLSSRGVKISPSSVEDLSFYVAEDTDY